MKKFFSLIAAVLFAGSMMATEVTFTNADFAGQGTANTGSEVAATKDGVTFTFSKGYSADESLRCYAHGALSITATATIEKINFTTTGGKTGGLDAEVTVGATSYEVADLASQARFTEIKVTLGEGGGVTPDPQPVVGDWDLITFTEAVTADNLAEDSTFNSTKEGFKVQIADAGNKMSIDANACRFGTAEAYDMYRFRLKSNGASGSDKNFLNISIPVDGKLRVAVRTASNSATDRALYILQGGDTLYNGIIQESMAVKVMEDATEVSVYPFVEVPVAAGTVVVRYSAALNFYGFGLNTTLSPALTDPTNCAEAAEAALSVEKNNDLYNDGKEYTIEGYVTSIAFAWKEGSMSFWMADTKEGGNVLEAYKCAIEKEEDAVRLGDKVAVTGKLTKYNTTPEFAPGCTATILERAEVVEPKNLGEKTIAEFLEMKNQVDTCILTGVVANVKNDQYGNFDLIDETDTVYVYGLLTAAGEQKKCFQEEGIAEGDTLKVLAIYGEYQGNPQVKNAIFVSLAKKETELTGDTINVTMSEGLRFYDNVAGAGWWELYGSDDKYVIELSNVSTEQIAGVYAYEDLDSEYAYIGVINGEDTTYVNFVDGAITLAVTNDGVTAVGALVGEDGNVYNLNLTYVIPTVQETVNVVIAEGALYDEYADYGLYAVYGKDENNVFVQLAIRVEGEFEGNFTQEDLDNQVIGSGIYEGEEPVEIYSAAITVTPGNGGDYNITADLLGYNNKLYKVSMYIGPEQGIEDVDAAVKAIKSLINGNVVIEKKGVKYNVNGAVIR